MTIELSKLMASVLQRMLVDEIENQKYWKTEDRAVNVENPVRDEIIKQCNDLIDELEKQGVKRYFKCY
jgi:hypothetical protein